MTIIDSCWPFRTVFDQFWPFWNVLDSFGTYWPLLTILDHFGPFWTVLSLFDRIWHVWSNITNVREGRVLPVCEIFLEDVQAFKEITKYDFLYNHKIYHLSIITLNKSNAKATNKIHQLNFILKKHVLYLVHE